jgi:hypothetical protein
MTCLQDKVCDQTVFQLCVAKGKDDCFGALGTCSEPSVGHQAYKLRDPLLNHSTLYTVKI